MLASIGANVRRRRLRAGLTQASLAEAVDLDLTYIQRIERGAANITVSVLVSLSEALRVPVTSLLKKSSPRLRNAGRPRARSRP